MARCARRCKRADADGFSHALCPAELNTVVQSHCNGRLFRIPLTSFSKSTIRVIKTSYPVAGKASKR